MDSITSTNVECKIIREGGTRAEIGGIEYHFAPLPDGAHVCAVENAAHADRFLEISDAYRLYRGTCTPAAVTRPAPPPPKYKELDDPVAEMTAAAALAALNAQEALEAAKASAPPPAPETPLGSSMHPASFTIHGTEYPVEEIVARAHAATAMSLADWNALQDDTRAEFIDEELDRINEAGPATPEESADVVLAALREKYKAKFNKAPHYRWTAEKITEALAE